MRHLFTSEWNGCDALPKKMLVEIVPPDGWEVHVPYPKVGENLYDATEACEYFGPLDFVILGRKGSLEVVVRDAGKGKLKVVAPRGARVGAAEVADLLAPAIPYYEDLMGKSHNQVLYIIGPHPMRPMSGEAKNASAITTDDNPFPFSDWGSATWTHELFHLYQPLNSSPEAWVTEGIATYYSTSRS